jgi:DNA-binding MarR family transcriptional regulator
MADQAHGGYELVALLALGFRAMVDELHRRLAALGFDDVRPAHGFAFVRLAPDGATGNELAEHLGVSKQAASQMVDYLERHGYVARQPDPRDGRGKIIVLTARGWACIRAVESILADIEGRLAGEVGAERMAALRADLLRLVVAPGGDGAARSLRPVW